ncbi:MAG: hypothetical protein LBN43_07425 [Oscillospiraceae bacterium]|jgi:beta-lactamase regulating signal transducer with metallopeptidase domain|nr:hypothetical protein [Oscillospiraceae bacterium]
MPNEWSNAFRALITMSLTGSAIAAILFAIKPLVKNRLPKTVQYYMWLIALAALVIPFSEFVVLPVKTVVPTVSEIVSENVRSGGEIMNRAAVEITGQRYSALPAPEKVNAESQVYWKRFNWNFLISYAPAYSILALLFLLLGYFRFLFKLRRRRIPAETAELAVLAELTAGRKSPKLYRNELAATPMLIGLFRPAIVLPDKEYSEVQLENILRHELTHYRRRDIWLKWLAVLVWSFHWFNPVAWLVRREIDRACELACDEAVIANLDANGKQNYGNTLISVVAATKMPRAVFSMTMCEEKRALKERLGSIMKSKKHTKLTITLSAVLLVAITGAAVLIGASGAENTNEYTQFLTVGEKTEITRGVMDDLNSALNVRFFETSGPLVCDIEIVYLADGEDTEVTAVSELLELSKSLTARIPSGSTYIVRATAAGNTGNLTLSIVQAISATPEDAVKYDILKNNGEISTIMQIDTLPGAVEAGKVLPTGENAAYVYAVYTLPDGYWTYFYILERGDSQSAWEITAKYRSDTLQDPNASPAPLSAPILTLYAEDGAELPNLSDYAKEGLRLFEVSDTVLISVTVPYGTKETGVYWSENGADGGGRADPYLVFSSSELETMTVSYTWKISDYYPDGINGSMWVVYTDTNGKIYNATAGMSFLNILYPSESGDYPNGGLTDTTAVYIVRKHLLAERDDDFELWNSTVVPELRLDDPTFNRNGTFGVNSLTIDSVYVSAEETARIQAMYRGSDLARKRGWSDAYISNMVAVAVNYTVDYDNSKVPNTGGQLSQYFYLSRDAENSQSNTPWLIFDIMSPGGQSDTAYEAFRQIIAHYNKIGTDKTIKYIAIDTANIPAQVEAQLIPAVQKASDENVWELLLDTYDGLAEKGYISDITADDSISEGILFWFSEVNAEDNTMKVRASRFSSPKDSVGAEVTVSIYFTKWKVTDVSGLWKS